MSDCASYKCKACSKAMVADVDQPMRHMYICSDEECRARSVIVADGTGGVLRYDVPPVPKFPTRGEGDPRPKVGASSARSGGADEGDPSARAVLQGSERVKDALNEAASLVPGGVAALLDGDPEEIAAEMIRQIEEKNG